MRLDTDKQKQLEPQRKDYAISQLEKLGIELTFESDTEIRFDFKGSEIKFFPYSGWHTGKTIKDGRGVHKLLNQLT